MTTLTNTTETENHLAESFQPSQNRVCFDNFENTRVSLIIPAYNECESSAELLEKSIGVLKGLRRAWEIIVVDDGSSDRTLIGNDPPLKLESATQADLRKSTGAAIGVFAKQRPLRSHPLSHALS